jgi:hypothetical protein
MSAITTVFQFEIRYNHILNFSQVARNILAPYVKLTQSIKIDNQNTLEERTILNFDQDNYQIIIGWDRLFIKGQGEINNLTKNNSSFEFPFLDIFNKINKLEGFGSVQSVLFAINNIKKIDISKDKLKNYFIEKIGLSDTSKILPDSTDFAVILEKKEDNNETSISFGPYFGTSELSKRPLAPISIIDLGETDFSGVLFEYKFLSKESDLSLIHFKKMIKVSNIIFENLCKKL